MIVKRLKSDYKFRFDFNFHCIIIHNVIYKDNNEILFNNNQIKFSPFKMLLLPHSTFRCWYSIICFNIINIYYSLSKLKICIFKL